jgi:hypothetical protein
MAMRHYYDDRNGGHLPSHIRGLFGDAVDTFSNWDGSGPEPTVEFPFSDPPRLITLSDACGLVWNCTDVLPAGAVCDLQDVLEGRHRRTYAAAARAMRQWIRERGARP